MSTDARSQLNVKFQATNTTKLRFCTLQDVKEKKIKC